MDAASEREHLVLITIFSCIAKSLKDWDSNFYNYILRYFINTFFFFFVTNKKDINWKNYALQGWKSQDKITMFPYKPLHKYKLHLKFFKEKENWNVKQFFFFFLVWYLPQQINLILIFISLLFSFVVYLILYTYRFSNNENNLF